MPALYDRSAEMRGPLRGDPRPAVTTPTPETVPTHCWACGHLVDVHDVDPETGYRPCRNVGHPKGVPCAECRRLIAPEHIAAIVAMRQSEGPAFKTAYGAFTVTYEHVREQFGDAWQAFFTDIHESAVASALIEYEAAHEAMVRSKVAEEIAARRCDFRACDDCTCRREDAATAHGDRP